MKQQASCKYWCYVCEAEFTAEDDCGQCLTCHSDAIERIEQDSAVSPSSFKAYQIAPQPPPISQPQQQQQAQTSPFGVMINHIGPLTQVGFNFGGGPFGQRPGANDFAQMANAVMRSSLNLGQMLADLMRENRSALTPVSPQQLAGLEQVGRVRECAICQELDESQEEGSEESRGYRLRCGHSFHRNCIGPWFEKTNTCPSCREAV